MRFCQLRHLKRNWRKYALLGAIGAATYYSYHNHRAVQRAITEQYNKIAQLVEQQKEKNAFSKYFSGWSTPQEPEPPTTTAIPVIIHPKVPEEPPVPPHTHSTIIV
ncbi:hypothetical protein M3Y99_01983700 [Aphelenchoides fujianensis]|nr:hypothetical protein M3Y99_01983700 [Aphelenchoides fujianensis]